MSAVQALGEGNQQPVTHQFLRRNAEPVNMDTFLRLCLSSRKAKEQSLICDGLSLLKDAHPSRSIERLSSCCF